MDLAGGRLQDLQQAWGARIAAEEAGQAGDAERQTVIVERATVADEWKSPGSLPPSLRRTTRIYALQIICICA